MINDLFLMTKDGLIYASHFIKEKKVSYKLNKKYNSKSISKVDLPPKIINKARINLDELEKRKFGEVLSYFTRVLETNFSKEDLAYFYKNIKTLKIEESKDNANKNLPLAKYSIEENKILLYDDYLKSIFHELFHVASSLHIDGKFYFGFWQAYSKFEFGYGLNEGYTELLFRRYFKNVSNFVESYEDEVKIASYLEKIVGKRKMESLYLRADLVGLINEIRNYLNNDEVVDLMSKIEKVSYLSRVLSDLDDKNFSPELYLDYLRDCYLMLFKTYIRKLRKEYEQGKIDKIILNGKVDDFLETEKMETCILGKWYPFADSDDFVKIFNETFKDFGIYMMESEEEKRQL